MNLDFLRILFKIFFLTKIKKYHKALHKCMKLVQMDLEPFPKKINYNKIVEKITNGIIIYKKIDMKGIDISHNKTKVLILNSELYDTGGHTNLAIQYARIFKNDYPLYIYLTNIFNSKTETARVKSVILKDITTEYYRSKEVKLDDKIIELYNYIIAHKITTLNVNIHMEDVVGSAVLYLINKHTNINIIFWNHASHYFCLGTIYAKKIISGLKNGESITPYLRGYNNLISLPFLMPDVPKNKDKSITREALGIPKDAVVTLTGCHKQKLGIEYFNLIKRVLDNNENIYHIWVGGEKEECIFYSNRFLKVGFTPNFNAFIEISDFYVDSFPQGSALALVDCIKEAKPVVIKINTENKFKSFEEYLYERYELNSKTSEEMFFNIMKLAKDKVFYKTMQKKVLAHYEKTYSLQKNKPLYEKLIV